MGKEYSQGVCHDGAVILCDGEPMTPEQIIEQLREAERIRQRLVRKGAGYQPVTSMGGQPRPPGDE